MKRRVNKNITIMRVRKYKKKFKERAPQSTYNLNKFNEEVVR